MKITVTALKPRNPLVAAARSRLAGSHRPSGQAMRLRERASLRRELDQLARPRYSP